MVKRKKNASGTKADGIENWEKYLQQI